MLKVLLKKQMAEVFRAYFYNRKTNKPRSKGNIILMFSLFAFLMIVVMGGAFTFMCIGIGLGMHEAGVGWLYFALMSAIAITLGTVGGVFSTYSGLYLPKDNDLLLSMPIPVRTIIMSRLVNVYLLGVMYSGVAMLPTLIVWWVIAGATLLRAVCGLILFLIVTLAVLMLSCLLGWLVAKISLKLKNKSFIVVLISLLFIGGYYVIYFKAQVWIRELVANAAVYGASIKDKAYPLYLFGSIGEGDLLATAIFAGVTLVLLALTMLLLSKNFIKLATASGGGKKAVYVEKKLKQRSAFGALLMKEFVRFTSSPNYMLNCGLGVLLLPIAGVFLLIKGAEITALLDTAMPAIPGIGAFAVCVVMMLAATMIDTAAPSVSLEGKSVWIPQTLPVEAKSVLMAKMLMQLLLTGAPMLFTSVCAAIAVEGSVADKITVCVFPLIFTLFASLFGAFAGTKNPILEWTTDIVPIKQGGAVMLALFGGWGFVAVFAALYLLFGPIIGLTPYLAVWGVMMLACSFLMYRWLNTKGAEIFARL